jgi:hypothetical protein
LRPLDLGMTSRLSTPSKGASDGNGGWERRLRSEPRRHFSSSAARLEGTNGGSSRSSELDLSLLVPWAGASALVATALQQRTVGQINVVDCSLECC